MNSEEITKYKLIFNQQQEPVVENNRILLWNTSGNTCEYVPLTSELKTHLNLVSEDENINEEDHVENCSSLSSRTQETDHEKFTWTHQSTLLMLDEYKSRISKFRDPKTKKKTLWEGIAEVMRKMGYLVDADTVDRKMRNMKNTFRVICDNNNKKKTTGRGRIHWEYYNYFQDLFKDDQTIHFPTGILSSTASTEITKNNTSPATTETPKNNTAVLQVNTNNPSSSSNSPLPSPSLSTISSATSQVNKLDRYRKRQMEIEEEKLEELKKLRQGVEESNRIQKEKLEVLRKYFLSKEKE